MPQNISRSISTGPMRLALALEQRRQHRLLYCRLLIRDAQSSLHWYIPVLFPQLPVNRHMEGHLERSLERILVMQAKGQARKGLFNMW